MLTQKILLERCLSNLITNISSMKKDQSPLKDPECFTAIREAYNVLSTLKINSQQCEIIINDLPERLTFYNQMLISLQVKSKSGAFLDQYFGSSDIHSFIKFMDAEINMLMRILSSQPAIQSKLIENGSIQILVEMFSLKSISNDLKLKMLRFFKLLNWNQEPEGLRQKLLYIIEDNSNAKLIKECLLLLFDKNVTEPKLAPRSFLLIINCNMELSDSIRHSCIIEESNNLFYESIKFFHNHNLLVKLITEFLNVIDNNNDSDWKQKEIAMYGLSKVSHDYLPNKLDDPVKKTIIERLKNALSHFYVNEYNICQLIGAGGRRVHLIVILAKFIDDISLSESDKDKIFRDIIFHSKNEQLIQTILSSTKLSNYLLKDSELNKYFHDLLQEPLTLQETKEAITEYLDLTTELKTKEAITEYLDLTTELKTYEASNIEKNLSLLVEISFLSKQQYQTFGYLVANEILGYICDMPMHYLSHLDFLKRLSTIKITEFNFPIAIGLIRFIIVVAKNINDEKQLDGVIKLALKLTLQLPNAFLQHNTLKYIYSINRRFSLVPESTLGDYYVKLSSFPDLSACRMTKEIKPSDLLLLGIEAEERRDFDSALRHYHKAEDLDYNYRFYTVIARALIYFRKAMPYTALEVLFDLKRNIYFFDLEFNELIYNLTGKLGCVYDAVDIFNQINKVLPFYQKNIMSFQTEIQLSKTHPLAAKFDELRQQIEKTFANNLSHNEAIELVNFIQNSLVKLSIPRDILDFCLAIFSPIKNIESSEYPNEWKRILLNYLSFIFQEITSIDYHWQTAGATLSCQVKDKLKQHIAESEIHKVYSRVFREDCSVGHVLDFLTKANVAMLTVTEFVRDYGQDLRIRGGYALGYSEDIAQTYDIYCFLFGLVRWETAYHKHDLSYVNDTKTSEFLDAISKTNKPIVFFLPTGLSRSNLNDNNLGVTYRECQWLLENIRKGNKNIKNVILVFDAYNYLPYHLLTEIKYFYQYGTVFRFNKIENRDFDEKVEIATAAARHFLIYVVDADKIKSTQQTFTDNIQAYLSINIDSIYSWIENTVKSESSMAIDLKHQLINCFRTILDKFCQTRDWQIFHAQLKENVVYYQQNHSAVKCLAISFFKILEDVDFLQYFIVMEQNIVLQEKQYQQYLGSLNFVSQLMGVYKFTEFLDDKIDIEASERESLETLLLLFKTFALITQLGGNVNASKFFEELYQKNQSTIRDVFKKVESCLNLEEMQDALLEELPKGYYQVEKLWKTFREKFENLAQLNNESDENKKAALKEFKEIKKEKNIQSNPPSLTSSTIVITASLDSPLNLRKRKLKSRLSPNSMAKEGLGSPVSHLESQRSLQSSDMTKQVSDNTVRPGYVRHKVTGDGNCGYTALWMTREQAVKLLLDHINSISDLIRIPVGGALLTEAFYNDLLNNNIIRVPHDTIINADEEHLRRYTGDLAIQSVYIQYDVMDQKIDAGYCHPAVLQALAHIQHIELHMWRLGESDVLIPHRVGDENYASHIPPQVDRRVDLLFVNGNHFETLELIGYDNGIPSTGIYPSDSSKSPNVTTRSLYC